MDHHIFFIAIITATFFVAGLVKGVTGMGLPTVAMGVLGALLSPLTAAGLLLVPSLVTNVWQLAAGRPPAALLRRLWPMMVTTMAGTLLGSAMLTGNSTGKATVALGAVLMVYAACALFARPFNVPARWEAWLSPMIGLATGLVTGATGVFVVPAVPYLQALQFDRDDLVQALGLSFTVSTLALGLALLWHGAVPTGEWLDSALAVAPALLGMAAGQAIRTRIHPALFRRGFLVALMLLGATMIAQAMA